MTKHVASRTLVKSPPELWAECSDAASLARHLDQFGEIRITRLDPETAVAWEGERARGTVRIEPAGWGTKVILTAVAVAEQVAPVAPEVPEAVEPEPEAGEVVDAPDEESEVVESPAEASEVVEAEVIEPGAEAGEVAEAELSEPEVAEAEGPEPEELDLAPESDQSATDPPARRRRFARLFGFFRAPEAGAVEPESHAPDEAAASEPHPPVESSPPAEPALARVHASPPPPEPPARRRAPRAAIPEPQAAAPEAQATTAPEPPAAPEPPVTEAALTAALDSLGQAHHRPYSRA